MNFVKPLSDNALRVLFEMVRPLLKDIEKITDKSYKI